MPFSSARMALLSATTLALAACGSHDGFDAGTDVSTDRAVAMDSGHDAQPDGTTAMDVTDAGARDVVTPNDVVGDLGTDASTDGGVTDGRTGDAGRDAGTDVTTVSDGGVGDGSVSDGAVSDGGVSDGAAGTYSFASPLQVDLGSVFNVDTVASSAATGESYPPLVPMDGSGYDLFTAGVGAAVSAAGQGLPNDGTFPSDGDHPNVQLRFSDTSVAPNSVILNAPAGATMVTFPITAAHFTSLQLYVVSTEGATNVTVTLSYSDATTSASSFMVPDWFNAFEATSPVFVVASGLSRYSAAGVDFSSGAALYGANVPVTVASTLTRVTVAASGSGRLVIYGATAY